MGQIKTNKEVYINMEEFIYDAWVLTPNDISFTPHQKVGIPMQASRASLNAWRHPKQAWWHKEYVFYCSILLFKRNERKRTIVMGLSVEFGPIPTEDAFARIILLFWENLSLHPYGRSFPEVACDKAFDLSIEQNVLNTHMTICLGWLDHCHFMSFIITLWYKNNIFHV